MIISERETEAPLHCTESRNLNTGRLALEHSVLSSLACCFQQARSFPRINAADFISRIQFPEAGVFYPSLALGLT